MGMHGKAANRGARNHGWMDGWGNCMELRFRVSLGIRQTETTTAPKKVRGKKLEKKLAGGHV